MPKCAAPSPGRRRFASPGVLPIAVIALVARSTAAAPGGIESVLISKSGERAEVQLRFACPNRLVGEAPMTGVVRSEIRLVPLEPCPGYGDVVHDATRPAGRAMAALEEVEYTTRGRGEALLVLQFDRPVSVTAEQSADLRSLSVRVVVPAGSAPTVVAVEPAPPAPATSAAPAGLTAEQAARAEERARRASQPRPPTVPASPDFALNLRSSVEPIEVATALTGVALAGKVAYISDLEIDGQPWHRLRLGFFASEAEANAAYDALRARFPEGWVTRVAARERLAATAGATVAGQEDAAATVAGSGAVPLTPAQATDLLGQARGAILDRDYPRAIELATRILEGRPAGESAEARELLGLARERNGQVASAIAEYRRYLADYPRGEGAGRVWQRLAAVTTARERPRESIRDGGAARVERAWQASGGFSQYYWLDSVDFGGEQGSVDQSAIFTDADMTASYDGERIDFGSRATVSYAHDLSDGDSGPDSQFRAYNLYVDLDERELGLSSRLGRQAARNQGVLGRFDGGLLSWQFAPSYRLSVLGGYPVYDPQEGIETGRTMYGLSLDALGFLDVLDVNLWLNYQEVDDIVDREAVGAEIRYLGDNHALVAAVDYDYGYSELGSIAVLGNWTFDNRVTLNARFDWRSNPYMVSEAALVEQAADSIQELLLTYTEGQIRQLALDRSAPMQSYAVGFARPISARWQVSADVTAFEYDGTPASGGAPETPDSGTLTYSYLSFIGSSLVREGDLSILSLRYADSGTSKSTGILLDTRLPLSAAARLNPKLLVSYEEIVPGDYTELVVRPGLGLLYRFGRRFQLEFDGGAELGRSERDDASNSFNGYYLYVGYRADF